jgi:hypothetical protein
MFGDQVGEDALLVAVICFRGRELAPRVIVVVHGRYVLL